MGILELLIVILLILWLLGYFGRGRVSSIDTGNWVHILLVIVVILVVLRLLGIV